MIIQLQVFYQLKMEIFGQRKIGQKVLEGKQDYKWANVLAD
jgi:hypothetical protein